MSNKILVIEDEREVRENIVTLLSEEGFSVYSVKNGEEGIKAAKEKKPDLIICDIMMSGIDGYEVLQNLYEDINTKAIPFIFLTAKVERSDFRKGMELGADDYIFKPFEAEELLNAIRSRIKRIQTLKGTLIEQVTHTSSKKYSIEDKVFVDVNTKPHLIKINAIMYISAERQYTVLHMVDNRSFLVRKSISSWEEELPVNYFLRIHRSTIINIECLVKMGKAHNSSFLIYLKNVHEPFVVSKRYSTKFRKLSI